MSSILIASVPVHGHVTPLLQVARDFVARGTRVRFLTGSRFADRVTATGATHLPLPADADVDDRTLTDQFPERAGLRGVKAVGFDIEHVFARPATAQYHAVLAAHRAEPVDAVLADPAFVGAALLAGHPPASRPALMMCGVVPLPLDSVDSAPFGMGLPPWRWFNRPRNTALAAVQRRLLPDAQRVVDDAHRAVHGTPMGCSLMDWGRRADAVVQFTVPAFEYPRSDAPTGLHFVGPFPATGSQAPLPDWWSDLDGSRPVVHVTQGTFANTDYGQLIGPALHALADDDVLVVVVTGGRPLDTLPALPRNARAATYLPYDELLPRTDVFVTNGGYGGVQYALRYGVPIVATGGKEDKPEVGARVSWSGVGRRIRSERPTPRALRRAVMAVLEQPRYRDTSRRLAADMAAAPGFAGLAQVLNRLIATPTG